MRNICVVGAGYVGLVVGACLSDLGNRVVCVDIDEERIDGLKQGKMPIFEPGLKEVVERNYAARRLDFTTSYDEGLSGVEFVFIAVGTPANAEGGASLAQVAAASASIGKNLHCSVILVNKSTVPIGTGDLIGDIVRENLTSQDIEFSVVSNPEFLREGSAVNDFVNPDRIVLGSTDQAAAQQVAELYYSLKAQIIITDLRTAEMIKYASNAFLATKISFINEIANICEALGADVTQVANGMGADSRIGHEFLNAGIGWGGSCFPKDVEALVHMAATHGTHPQLLRTVIEINRDQRKRVIQKLRDILGNFRGKTIGVLGLAFKPNTDDMRDAPAVEIIHMLQHEGAQVKVYDPQAMENAGVILQDVIYCKDPYAVAGEVDALVLVTEWNEFKELDMKQIKESMRQPVLLDGRNIYDSEKMKEIGFIYLGMGRG